MSPVRVLETNVLHLSAMVHWLDGATAERESEMLSLDHAITLTLTERPSDVRVLHGRGKTAFWRRPSLPIVDGVANDADRTRPAQTGFGIAGTASDPSERYNPRRFELAVGDEPMHTVVLYPAVSAIKLGGAGGLFGSLRWAGTGAQASWALLTLTVSLTAGAELVLRAQADGRGEFILPFTRLPALPEGVDDYAGWLHARALPGSTADTPVDPADLDGVMIEGGESEDEEHLGSMLLQIVPGTKHRAQSPESTSLVIQLIE